MIVQEAIKQAFTRSAAQFYKDVQQEFNRPFSRTGAQGVFNSPLSATGKTQKSFNSKVVIDGERVILTMYAEDSWRWANQGRGPGRRPPVFSVFAWAAAKGILRGNAQQQESMAWAIAVSIGKRGTSKQPSRYFDRLVPPLIEDLEFQVNTVLKDFEINISQAA